MNELYEWLKTLSLSEILGLLGVSGTAIIGRLIYAGKIPAQIILANAEAKRADAATESALVVQLQRAEDRLDKLEAKQHITETERDAAMAQANDYRIALEQSEAKHTKYQRETDKKLETLQGEVATVKSENGGLKKQLEEMQTTIIKMQATVDKAVGDRDDLAKELETERTHRLELERVAAKEREQHAIEIARRDAKLEVYEDTNNKLIEKIQPFAAESSEALPAQEGAESKETHTQENQ